MIRIHTTILLQEHEFLTAFPFKVRKMSISDRILMIKIRKSKLNRVLEDAKDRIE